ncbi:MAG TPA: beta-L-arabinofuranosidase domain-containing protein, partial [Terriglobales bacterium]|nr:beta-L-arabinofuranosidase domain-containing protein [Terriglobales bacterium]
FWIPRALAEDTSSLLQEFGYRDVILHSELHEKQFSDTHALLMELSENSLLKPFRQMSGLPAPGNDLGDWYDYVPGKLRDDGVGFAPSAPFGQWMSALARMYAVSGDQATREKMSRLIRLYAKTISPEYYTNNRFPAYCYDKLVCGLMDAHRLAGDPDAFAILDQTTKAALPGLPGHAIEHGVPWRGGEKDDELTWDESYTISENLFLAYQYGAGKQYRDLGAQYLDDIYYDPLARGESNLDGRHAYSHVNSLSSAMQAYLTLGSDKHLRAAKNGFDFLEQQSFATGGWGPDETLRAPGSDDVFESLTKTHHSFETPCGSYAHFKLTRYLLRITRQARYGDSMERVMYNTVLGAKPLLADGNNFYYSDYNFKGSKFYHDARWACCSGTLPQVVADYRLNTYFRNRGDIYVNLYIPSTLNWQQDGRKFTLTQSGNYPFEGNVRFELTASKKSEFTINLRIPAWADGATVAVNGKRVTDGIVAGKFATIRRKWKSGDQFELELPLRTRVEPINNRHPETVALLSGPLVLFAIGTTPASLTKAELLSAKKVGPQKWQAKTDTGNIDLLPFPAIADETYTTYLKIG